MTMKIPQQLIKDWAHTCPERVFLKQPVNGQYLDFTFHDVYEQSSKMASALLAQGLEPGDKVAILSKNCAHWFMADFAIMLAGLISIPIYPTANRETIAYVLEHSEAKLLFAGKLDDWESQKSGVPESMAVIGFPYGVTTSLKWDELIADQSLVNAHEPQWDDIMTILYTSGSTGKPKGAIHSYRTFMAAGYHAGGSIYLGQEDRILSYLPLAHCTERAYVESTSLSYGQQVWFAESLDTFARDLVSTSPTIFGSVPRLWTQFQTKIHERLPPEKLQKLLRIPLLNRLVKAKIKRSMGLHKARLFLSGSAPISQALLRWYQNLGIDITEGWGMTETFAYATLLPYGEKPRTGSIGKAGPEVDVKIAEDGEILVKSPTLMQGYYKMETDESVIVDGYLKTGDKGEIDSEGYIKITGRLKEIFKTAKGKYVAPAKLEGLFADSPFLEQACVLGSGLTQPVAILQLNPAGQAVPRDALTAHLDELLASVNEKLEKHEKISGVVVAAAPWTVESGILTPTLKIKRGEIEKLYQSQLESDVVKGVVFEPQGEREVMVDEPAPIATRTGQSVSATG